MKKEITYKFDLSDGVSDGVVGVIAQENSLVLFNDRFTDSNATYSLNWLQFKQLYENMKEIFGPEIVEVVVPYQQTPEQLHEEQIYSPPPQPMFNFMGRRDPDAIKAMGGDTY